MNAPVISNSDSPPNFDAIWQETLDWFPTDRQRSQLQFLYVAVVTANHNLNLTRITEPAEFWEKHLWDSLRGVGSLITASAPLKVIDIGTGAGFPGLPLAIARSDWELTLVDSTAKKIGFIQSFGFTTDCWHRTRNRASEYPSAHRSDRRFGTAIPASPAIRSGIATCGRQCQCLC